MVTPVEMLGWVVVPICSFLGAFLVTRLAVQAGLAHEEESITDVKSMYGRSIDHDQDRKYSRPSAAFVMMVSLFVFFVVVVFLYEGIVVGLF